MLPVIIKRTDMSFNRGLLIFSSARKQIKQAILSKQLNSTFNLTNCNLNFSIWGHSYRSRYGVNTVLTEASDGGGHSLAAVMNTAISNGWQSRHSRQISVFTLQILQDFMDYEAWVCYNYLISKRWDKLYGALLAEHKIVQGCG